MARRKIRRAITYVGYASFDVHPVLPADDARSALGGGRDFRAPSQARTDVCEELRFHHRNIGTARKTDRSLFDGSAMCGGSTPPSPALSAWTLNVNSLQRGKLMFLGIITALAGSHSHDIILQWVLLWVEEANIDTLEKAIES